MTAQQAADGLFDRQIRHRIALERYAAGEVREILKFIQALEDDTLDKLTRLRTRPDLTRGERATIRTLENFLREVRLIYAEGYSALRERAFQGLEELAAFEAEFQRGSLAAAIDDLEGVAGSTAANLRAAGAVGILTPNAEQLRAVIESRPAEGRFVSAWFELMEQNQIERVETAIRLGFVEGETIGQLRTRLAGEWNLNRRGAETVIRTMVTHIAAEVAQETYTSNPDIVQQVEWVSILDSRTSPVCRARDGKRYAIDKGPRPPAHPRCRSTIIPIMDGIDPPERPTYGEWLKRQPVAVQQDILGKTGFALFSRGKLPLDRFVDANGEPLTLDQMRRMFPEAFKRAGVR